MIGVPTLFARSTQTGKVLNDMSLVSPLQVPNLVAMELVPGVDIRLTVRSSQVVRLEVAHKPSVEQLEAGVTTPWWREIQPDDGPGYWLWEAVKSTDISNVPDGEWAGEAIGENIRRNMLGIEGHTILLSSLFPWRDTIIHPIPPQIDRTPFEYEDLQFWLNTTPSFYHPRAGYSLYGVVWWLHDVPVAQIKVSDFPRLTAPPNKDVALIELRQDEELAGYLTEEKFEW